MDVLYAMHSTGNTHPNVELCLLLRLFFSLRDLISRHSTQLTNAVGLPLIPSARSEGQICFYLPTDG